MSEGSLFAQETPPKTDTLKLVYPFRDFKNIPLQRTPGIYMPNPSNIRRTVEFDPISKQYIIRERIGERLYRAPQYLADLANHVQLNALIKIQVTLISLPFIEERIFVPV